MKNLLILVLITIFSAGCTTTEYIKPNITVNSKPAYATVKAEEYQCMEFDAKKRLQLLVKQRDLYIDHLLEQLEPYR